MLSSSVQFSTAPVPAGQIDLIAIHLAVCVRAIAAGYLGTAQLSLCLAQRLIESLPFEAAERRRGVQLTEAIAVIGMLAEEASS